MGKLTDLSHQTEVADDGTLTLDYFTDQFGKKTQYADFFEPKPETEGAAGDIPENLIDPDHDAGGTDEQPGGGIWSPEGEERDPISPERFAKTGHNIARLVDTGFDFAASNLIAKGSGKSYHASDKDLEDIGEAWAEIAEEKQWELGPVPRLLLLYIIVYGPLAKQAFEDRRIMELERRADDTERTLKEQAAEIKRLKDEQYRRNNENGGGNTASVGAEG